MEKHIYVDDETKVYLAKLFGVVQTTVWRALTYKRGGKLSQRIRKAAMEHGGVVVGGSYSPDFETEHDTAGGTMTQRFGKRVAIVARMSDGHVRLMVDGEEKESREITGIAEFMAYQGEVALMAAEL